MEYFEKLREDSIPKIEKIGYSFEVFKEAMLELIGKYDLKNKKILSIGALFGFEEYYFSLNECVLTLIDKDQYAMRHLKTLKPSNTPTLTYIFGDLRDLILEDEWDVIYVSCLPGAVLWENDQRISNALMKYICNMKEGGLFICKSNDGGSRLDEPHNIELIKMQFESKGLQLLHIYHHEPYTMVSLIIGFKGSKEEALEFMEKIDGLPEITCFIGKSKSAKKINKSYQLR